WIWSCDWRDDDCAARIRKCIDSVAVAIRPCPDSFSDNRVRTRRSGVWRRPLSNPVPDWRDPLHHHFNIELDRRTIQPQPSHEAFRFGMRNTIDRTFVALTLVSTLIILAMIAI